MIVVDTDILIDALNGREPAVSWLLDVLSKNEIATTAVSQFELLAGANSPSSLEKIQALLENLDIMPLDSRSAETAAGIQRQLGETGQGIGMADSLIAGITLARSAQLATQNQKHFARVPGLKLAHVR